MLAANELPWQALDGSMHKTREAAVEHNQRQLMLHCETMAQAEVRRLATEKDYNNAHMTIASRATAYATVAMMLRGRA